MLPQVLTGGWMPKPRKLRAASVRMAPPTSRVACTMITGSRLGTMCRSIRRGFLAPRARAASMYSRLRSFSASLRTSRAVPIQPNSDSTATTMMMLDPAPSAALKAITAGASLAASRPEITSNSGSVGNESISSMKRLMR